MDYQLYDILYIKIINFPKTLINMIYDYIFKFITSNSYGLFFINDNKIKFVHILMPNTCIAMITLNLLLEVIISVTASNTNLFIASSDTIFSFPVTYDKIEIGNVLQTEDT